MTLEELNELGSGHLPGLLGIEILAASRGSLDSRLLIGQHHLAPNGRLHAATMVALADTSCGYACRFLLPEDARNFATIELKSNFVGTVIEGAIRCEARVVHAGRSTQVWDAEIRSEADRRLLAVFRCTQMVIY